MKDVMTPEEIKAVRNSLGLTAKELADEIGLTENTVNRWEMGIRSPSGSAVKILRGLQKDREPRSKQAAVPA